jgi:hypothetical protein
VSEPTNQGAVLVRKAAADAIAVAAMQEAFGTYTESPVF